MQKTHQTNILFQHADSEIYVYSSDETYNPASRT